MPRVKRGTKRHDRRKKLLSLAKGYYLNKSKLYKFAKESVDKALVYAYRKMLADIALQDAVAFTKLVDTAKQAVAAA